MTLLGVYVAAGIAGCAIFGGIMVWADNRNHRHLSAVATVLSLISFPALIIGSAIIAAGSIGLG